VRSAPTGKKTKRRVTDQTVEGDGLENHLASILGGGLSNHKEGGNYRSRGNIAQKGWKRSRFQWKAGSLAAAQKPATKRERIDIRLRSHVDSKMRG